MGRSKLMNFLCSLYIYHTCTYGPTRTNVFVFLFCRAWTYPEGARNPNCLLGAVLKEQFPGLVQLPGEGRVPEPGLTLPHYKAARCHQMNASTTLNAVPKPTWWWLLFG